MAVHPPRILPRRLIRLQCPKSKDGGLTRHIHPDDLADFQHMKSYVRSVIGERLDIEITWSRQHDQATERLFADVLQKYPMFAAYKDRWPVRFYCQQAFGELRRRTCGKRSQQRRDRATEKPIPRAPGGCSESIRLATRRSSRLVSTMGLRTSSGSAREARAMIVCNTNLPSSQHHAAARSGTGVGGEVVPAHHSQCPVVSLASAAHHRKDSANGDRYAISRVLETTSSLSIVVTNQLSGGEQDVLAFLISVDRSLAGLFDRLRFAGITSRDRLEALAKWPPEEREMFLLRELRVSAYEQKLVSDALARFSKAAV
ncbi:hypothetical protein NUW54_g5858 [Trametes sanguinea]|uniref:Uncharacterized protein n=1 Tax=Trametes sanguinea TaxID=158606 RepID=A0ACC1PTY3_9APHY|nr:hypothetical protein NUW54_g5858 [Trametes sanguinea]